MLATLEPPHRSKHSSESLESRQLSGTTTGRLVVIKEVGKFSRVASAVWVQVVYSISFFAMRKRSFTWLTNPTSTLPVVNSTRTDNADPGLHRDVNYKVRILTRRAWHVTIANLKTAPWPLNDDACCAAVLWHCVAVQRKISKYNQKTKKCVDASTSRGKGNSFNMTFSQWAKSCHIDCLRILF